MGTGSRYGGGRPDSTWTDRYVPLSESGRQLSSNPGFDPDIDPPSRDDEPAEAQPAANQAAVFGDRLKRMMGVQTDEAEPVAAGELAEASASMQASLLLVEIR